MQYFNYLTSIGEVKQAAALAGGTPIELQHFAVGDGGGSYVTPSPSQTALVNEVYRTSIKNLEIDPIESNRFVVEGLVPKTVGGFTVREVGVFDKDGDLIFVANYPDSEQPDPSNSAVARELLIRLVTAVSGNSTVVLTVDQSNTLASLEQLYYWSQKPMLDGPSELTENTSGSYKITNFGFDAEYSVSSDFGVATLNHDTITFDVESFVTAQAQSIELTAYGILYKYPIAVLALQVSAVPSSISYASSDSDGAVDISWSEAAGAAGYRLERQKDGGSWELLADNLVSLNYQVTGLVDGSYLFRVRSFNSAGNSAFVTGAICVVAIPPAMPASISYPTTDSDGSVLVSWAVSVLANSYTLEQQENGGSWTQVASNVGAESYTVNSLNHGSNYKFRVKAVNSAGSSQFTVGNTNLAVTISPEVPTSINYPTTDDDGSVLVLWSPAARADFYILQSLKSGSSTWQTVFSGILASEFTVAGLEHDASYQFRVAAANSAGTSGYRAGSGSVLVEIPPLTPASISYPTTDSDGSVLVSWGSALRAESYVLEQQKDGGSWTQVAANINATNRVVSGLSHDSSYKFRVKAVNGAGASIYQTSSNALLVDIPPAVPASISYPTTDSDGSVLVSWGSALRAESYVLEQQKGGGSWTVISAGLTSLSRTVGNLAHDSRYKFRVKAVNSGGSSSYRAGSNILAVKMPPATPNSISYSNSSNDGSVGISWSSSSRADSYTLEQQKDGGSWTVLSSGYTSNIIAPTGLSHGSSYKFRVKAFNAAGSSSYRTGSNILTVTIAPEIPSSMSYPSSDTDGSFVVSWGAGSRADSYTLQRQRNGGSWTTVATGSSGLSYSQSGLSAGTYRYRVKAVNAAGSSSYKIGSSVVVSISTGGGGGGGGCFALGTPVLLDSGEMVAIETLSVGDKLRSYEVHGMPDESDDDWRAFETPDPSGQLTVSEVVGAVFDSYKDHYILNGEINCTYEQTFFAKRDGVWAWRLTEDLAVGDRVLDINQDEVEIESIQFVDEPIEVYTIDVESVDNYFAGPAKLLTHNIEKK